MVFSVESFSGMRFNLGNTPDLLANTLFPFTLVVDYLLYMHVPLMLENQSLVLPPNLVRVLQYF